MQHVNSNASQRTGKNGFALVATVLLMVLLSILAVGMLSLSAVTLRTGSRVDAMSEARANARMALMVAIGELQKSMGPDRRISATSEILGTTATPVAKPNITGVWESWWDFDPSAATPPDYQGEKSSRFQRWLVSSADSAAPESRDFVTSGWQGKTIELVGSGSLGDSATDQDKVTAGLVPVSRNGEVQGSYAWHVADESVKARINLYRDPGQNSTLSQKRALLAGHRPDPSVIREPDGNLLIVFPTDLNQAGYQTATTSVGKITNLNQAELLDQAEGKIKPLRNDITPYSLGVMTDVRGGGLKQDLSSVFEMASATSLPTEFNNEKLYQSTLGISGVSDPNWSTLASYYNSFRDLITPETNPTVEMKPDAASVDPVPDSFSPAPVIAKVDTIFSLVCRPLDEIHWLGTGVKEKWEYFTGLIFTPVVTLHNPYNVNVSFYKIEVEFENIPIAFNFMLDEGSGFRSQSVIPGDFESLNTMAYSHAGHRDNKLFKITIADWSDSQILSSSSAINGPITLKPGQTLVCGPILPPDASLKKDSKLGSNTIGFDWKNDLTEAVKAQPAFTPGIGFEVYGVTIGHTYRYGEDFKGSWVTFNFLADQAADPAATHTDEFYVEFKFKQPSWYTDDLAKSTATLNKIIADPSFGVTAKIQATADDTLDDYAKLQFDYQDDSTLSNAMGDRVYRYPPTDSLIGREAAAPSGVPYSEQASYIHPFAVFSATARTTSGGVYETGQRTEGPVDSPELNLLQDGRLAGKPFLFHNPSRSNFTMNLADEKPGVQSYELNLQPFLSKGDYEDYMDVDASNRVPALTGNTTTSGIKSGSYLEIPSGPLQTIADFRRSNALTTTYLPHFVQPVANSLLHPLMSPDKVIETNSDIATHALLDHSVLANHALYDRFYFSTFATRGSTKPDIVFEQFMNADAPLASQAFQPYLASGRTVEDAKAELFASGMPQDQAYKTAAEYQMIRGPFNVNSTSVQAWKAVLASMNKAEVQTLWARNSQLEFTTASGVPITAMSLLNGGAVGEPGVESSKIDNARTNDWNGYRELTEPELETLAEKIVEQVRERGPFLSMSEFVNRQVGPLGPKTLRGALEAAIAEAEINEEENSDSTSSFLNQVPITGADVSDASLYAYETPEATTGNPAAGAPGWVTQGDLLRILEPSATVRGDTFAIRVYGEAQDANGNITARAYAEAVVQRVPDYVDPVDRPSLNTYSDATAADANKEFGRRINIVSFRWLSGSEI